MWSWLARLRCVSTYQEKIPPDFCKVTCKIFLENIFCQVEGLLNNGPGYSSLLGKISDFRWDFLHQVIHNTGSQSHTKVIQTLIWPEQRMPTLGGYNFAIFASGVSHNLTQSTFTRSCLTEVVAYGQIPVPLVYTQVFTRSHKSRNHLASDFHTVWFTKYQVAEHISYDALVQQHCLESLPRVLTLAEYVLIAISLSIITIIIVLMMVMRVTHLRL